MGAAYLSILENGPLAGIKDPQVMRYAVVVSYANGAGALLRTFSSNRQDAIDEINDLDADEFFEHVVKTSGSAGSALYLEAAAGAGRHVAACARAALHGATHRVSSVEHSASGMFFRQSLEVVADGSGHAAFGSPVAVAGSVAAGEIPGR